MGRKFTDIEDSSQYLLIKEIKNSRELFKSLRMIVNDKQKEELSNSINSLTELIEHVKNISNQEIINLLEEYEENKRRIAN